jgi:plastocyanin
MSSRQLTRSDPITQQRKIRFVFYAMLVTGIAACTKDSEAQAGANSDPYSSSSAAAPTSQRDAASPVNVRLSEWKIDLSQLTVPTGEVEFAVTNRGTMPHSFEVEGQGLEKDLEPIAVGATSTLRVTLPPGTYSLYCPIDNGAHKKMGMIGHIDVLGSVDLGRLVTAMKNGGYVMVLRHGATNPDQADTDPLHRDNIGAQRLLSAQGREVAVRVGERA